MSFLSDPSWSLRRFGWTNGHYSRALFAQWDDFDGLWRCWIQGYGMVTRPFVSFCQSGALTEARCITSRWSPSWRVQKGVMALYEPWDGIPDVPRYSPAAGYQLDLFLSMHPGGGEAARRLPPPGAPRDLYVPVTRKVSLKNETRPLVQAFGL